MKSIYSFITAREKVMKAIFAFTALFSIIALLVIAIFLFSNGIPFIIKNSDTFFTTNWDTISPTPSYGIFALLITTLYVTAISVVLGVTLGLFTAVCLYKFCPKRLVTPIAHTVNLLAGIPSVIYGLIGLQFIVPFMRDYISPNGFGYGILSASLVLAVMILPTVVSVSLDALNAVPKSYFEGALALGATKEQATFKVLIPAAKSGIFAGVVLATGRALGETMAVAMVIGSQPQIPTSLFQSVATLTSNIAQNAMEATGETKIALVASGVILFFFTFVLNFAFSLLKRDRKEAKKKVKLYEKTKSI